LAPDNGRRPIPIAKVDLAEDEIEAAVAVLRSGSLRQGRVCTEFEQRFAEMTGAKHAVVVSSGTAALHLAWLALLQPGDEVLVPAFSFVATASTVVLAGGRPVFCDVEPGTATLDVDDARKKLTDRTVAVSPVHLYGGVCDVDGIAGLASEHNLKVVWDAAQAHGALHGAVDAGALPDMSCFSFYASKNMTTGEGGMITTPDDALAQRLRLLRSHGQAQKYQHTLIGLNYRMTDVQAAIGLKQLERLPAAVASRRANAALLDDLLAGLPGVALPVERPGTTHCFHLYTITVDPEVAGVSRDELQQELGDLGIETAVHYPTPIHRQPVFARDYAEVSLPVSERLAGQVLSIPVHPALDEADVRRVGEAVRSVVVGARA